MKTRFADPVQALTALPPDPGGWLERQWLQNTMAWLKSVPPDARTERLRELADGLCQTPPAKEKFQALWVKAFAPRLFSEAGMPEGTSLPREAIGRIKRRILPQLEDELDLYTAMQMAELNEKDADWIAGLSEADIAPWRELLSGSAVDLPVAVRLLAVRAAGIGLSRGVMKVMPFRYETESPFYDLVDAAEELAHSPGATEQRERLRERVAKCKVSADISHARMEERGVSSDLVFRLDLVIAQLDRIDALLRVISGSEDGRLLGAALVRAFVDERGVKSLMRNSVDRLARQIVTHTGKSGEHYIAGSLPDWMKMGYGAVGAGGITAFTALFKYIFASMALAPLWIGVAHSLNYTVSFVLMQFLGWRLASKMPSMTAAALCDAMNKEDGMHAEVELVEAITRTQFVVTIGNLAGAIPLSILIDYFIQWRHGAPFLDHEAAMHGLRSMHPFLSLTIPFAALTGCFLWLSSLVAGWTANWMVRNSFSAAIAQSRRIRSIVGEKWAEKMAGFVKRHLSGVAGYTSLGLMLGLLPFVSVFAGFPVEVRHVTLASASLAYDVSSLAWSGDLPWREIAWAGAGLLATGVLNFSVSFALGLWLAMRARDMDTRGRRRLVGVLWGEFCRQPSRFLWSHTQRTDAAPSRT